MVRAELDAVGVVHERSTELLGLEMGWRQSAGHRHVMWAFLDRPMQGSVGRCGLWASERPMGLSHCEFLCVEIKYQKVTQLLSHNIASQPFFTTTRTSSTETNKLTPVHTACNMACSA